MVYIHVKKPRLMQLSKTKNGYVKNPVKRDSNTCKIYDAYMKQLEPAHSKYKKNLNATGNMYREKS